LSKYRNITTFTRKEAGSSKERKERKFGKLSVGRNFRTESRE